MLDDRGLAEVERVIRDVADREIRPRFGRLTVDDVLEKGPGDLVTVADRAAEEALTTALEALVPGSVTVGEEAVALDAGRLGALDGDAPVWIIDPIDGTFNFANDSPRYTTLVAPAHHGVLLASWTYAPELDRIATARSGGGATVDGRPVRLGPGPRPLRHLDVCAPVPRWWTPDVRARMNRLGQTGIKLSYLDTSGLEYIELATGRRDAMVLTWEFPWDHAAGLLLHTEAGGATLTSDGQPFRLAGGNALPFICAPDPDTAQAMLAAMSPA